NDPFVTNVANFGVTVQPTNSSTYFLNPYSYIMQPPPPGQTPYLAPDLALPDSVTKLTTYFFGNPYDGSSYPIYVDPVGCKNFGTSTVLGFVPPPGTPPAPGYVLGGYSSIPRTPLSAVNAAVNVNQALDRWCTLTDDITFQENGTPSLSTSTVQ